MCINNEILIHAPVMKESFDVKTYKTPTPSCFYPATSKQRVPVADETPSATPNSGIPAQAFVILSHYSNENINEFDSVGIRGFYLSLNAAQKAADTMLAEDKKNGCHNETVPFTTDDCCEKGVFDDYPVYVAGQAEEGRFDSYHNLYAVFGVFLADN